MQAIAKARYVRTSPRKARLVIDAIRGKRVDEALAILKFTPNFAAKLIEKVVISAKANAETNHKMDGENLKVAMAMVDGGPSMKRVRYAPMGRGYRMVKRTSHICIGVEECEPLPEKKLKKKPVAKTVKSVKRAVTKTVTRAKAEPKAALPAEKAEEAPKKRTRKKAEVAEVTEVIETAAPIQETEVVAKVSVPVVEAPVQETAVEEPEGGK